MNDSYIPISFSLSFFSLGPLIPLWFLGKSSTASNNSILVSRAAYARFRASAALLTKILIYEELR